MKNCNEIQQKLAELEFNQIIEDKAVLQHIATCDDCQSYQMACGEMHQAMNQMTDFDADDALLESTLSSILSLQDETPEVKEPQKPKRILNTKLSTQWASALAASFMLVSLIALFPYNSISNFGLSSVSSIQHGDRIEQQKLEEPNIENIESIENIGSSAAKKSSAIEEEKRAIAKRKKILQRKKEINKSDYNFYDIDVADEVISKQRRMPKKSIRLSSTPTEPLISAMDMSGELHLEESTTDFRKEIQEGFSNAIPNELNLSRIKENKQQTIGNELAESMDEYEDDQDKDVLDRVVVTGSRIRATDLEPPAPVISISRERGDTIRLSKSSIRRDMGKVDKAKEKLQTGYKIYYGRPVLDICCKESDLNPGPIVIKKLNKTKEKHDLETNISGLVVVSDSNVEQGQDIIYKTETVGKISSPGRKNADLGQGLIELIQSVKRDSVNSPLLEAEIAASSIAPLTSGEQYLLDIGSLDNLTYQSTSGYWANTYLPGDSSMRLLEANLANNKDLPLSNSISQNIQPFDYPENSALAVYLNSDVANVQGQKPTRMRIQVGIQASNRKGGKRSPMNIALVFDLRNKTTEYAVSMKALLLALLKSKQPSDNISLTIAGNVKNAEMTGGNLIEAKDFSHGQILVAMDNLFSGENNKTHSLNLNQAIQLVSKQLKNEVENTALGSNVIMLFSANNINNIAALESMVHANAINGITLSTVSLSAISLSTISMAQDNHQQLKKLALAGQGHARILQNSYDAKRVIDEELLASSRAVARALRLRIRLAKGVKLIEVVDSYNLNEKQSQRVRDAEQSLDKRLSKNLGIKADRGEDEEGIQIVIPSFFAGDTHVILLDVVATDTTTVADVTLRYKDLLYLRNAISRKQLNLETNPKALGPLQLNVMKNVLASRFSRSIKQASKKIRQGNQSLALALLLEMQQLYESMRQQFPLWNKDQEILRDEKLLQQYINLLDSISINDVQKINYIIDSLQYISWRKHVTLSQ